MLSERGKFPYNKMPNNKNSQQDLQHGQQLLFKRRIDGDDEGREAVVERIR